MNTMCVGTMIREIDHLRDQIKALESAKSKQHCLVTISDIDRELHLLKWDLWELYWAFSTYWGDPREHWPDLSLGLS